MIYRILLYGACFFVLASLMAILLAGAAVFWFFVALIAYGMGWL